MRYATRLIYAVLLISVFIVSACNGGKMPEQAAEFKALKDIPEDTWTTLSQKTLFFGHQSVGYNILDGINDLMAEYPQIKLNIVETTAASALEKPIFAHSKVGKNSMPQSKIDAFATFAEQTFGNKADIAFFKLCYVDIKPDTDVDALFAAYKNTMHELKQLYPKTTFVHVTVPLTTRQTGPKAWIKGLLGKPIWGVEDNINRNRFNELLRSEFGEQGLLFDLALAESTTADGTKSSFTKDGKRYNQLAPSYTYDGGHLNETGRKVVAERLLVFLANLI